MRFLKRLSVAVAMLAGCLGAGPLAAADAPFAPKPGQGTYLVLSDIHFDPFAAPGLAQALSEAPLDQWAGILKKLSPKAFATFGEDSNYSLFNSAMVESKKLQPNYDFVLLLGDLLSHDFQEHATEELGSSQAAKKFAVKTSRFVANEIEREFGATPVIPAIGNNDDNCGDYAITPDGTYLQNISKAWSVLRANPVAQRDFARLGAFMMKNPVVEHHRIVVVNSVFFSSKYDDTCRPSDADPGAEMMDWLAGQLKDAAAAGDAVTLTMHIPPGFDGFASQAAGTCSAVPLWAERYQNRFNRLAVKYRDTLVLGFAGHLHMDQFRVFGSTQKDAFLPIHAVPAISPIYFNNPGFTVFLYNRASGAAVDYAVHYTQLNSAPPNPAWEPEYKWGKAYGYGRINASSLWSLSKKIGPGGPLETKFKAYFQVKAKQKIDAELWRSYSCSQTQETAEGFSACRCPTE